MTRLDLLLAALAHPTRRAALRLLRRRGELCLCELMASIGVGQSTMSRHMATRKEAGLVRDRRDAQWVRYRFDPDPDPATTRLVMAALDAGGEEAGEQAASSSNRSAA